MTDTALGEYDVENNVGMIDWKVAPNTVPDKLQSFHELPDVVSEWKLYLNEFFYALYPALTGRRAVVRSSRQT